MTMPALLAISHGTASREGQAAVAALVAAVAERLPEVTVRLGHVDVQQPDVAASLDSLPAGEPVVVVPLLLSAGYHVRVDLKKQTAGRPDVTIAPALGPDPRLVDALLARLAPLAPTAGDALVLAVAGSSDDRANDDCRTVAAMLAERLGTDVAVGFLAAADPRLGVAVTAAREGVAGRGVTAAREDAAGTTAANDTASAPTAAAPAAARVIVANYLLAPGYFHDLAVRLAADAPVARPLLDHDETPASLVDIVVDRYRSALS